MAADLNAARMEATAATLRYCAGLQFAQGHEDEAKELYAVADEVAAGRVADWDCCPVCEEVECDEGCPLAPVRDAVRAFMAAWHDLLPEQREAIVRGMGIPYGKDGRDGSDRGD